MARRGSFYRRLAIISIAIISIYFITITTFQLAFGTSTPFMVVVSNSMYPTLKINDIIVVKSVSIDEVEIGDIIVFRSPLNPRTPIVHRVLDILVNEQGVKMIITKGDRNLAPDPWTVTEDLLIGKVIYVIPQIGAIPKFLNTYPTLKYALAITIIAIIVISEYIDYRRSHAEELDKRSDDNQENKETT
ncbi:MAG TPA: signal peptidase I [Thermoprotei archaeon]|nr:signal peptidase I [Thermoprotei archaeon]